MPAIKLTPGRPAVRAGGGKGRIAAVVAACGIAWAVGVPGAAVAVSPPVGELKPQPGAPLTVSGELGPAGGRVGVAFRAAATNVVVELEGLDGLVIRTPAEPVLWPRVEAGAVRWIAVGYRQPPAGTAGRPPRSALAVHVEAWVDGRRRTRDATLAVPTGP